MKHCQVSNCIDGVVKLVFPVVKEWQTSNLRKHKVGIEEERGGESWQIGLYPDWS